jgi:hypothetical protein
MAFLRNISMRKLLGCVILLIAGCNSSTPAPPTPQNPVAAWGDSLTYGNQDSSAITYPGELQETINTPVYNGGVVGQTSTQIAQRMLAATDKFGDTAILWVGRNNYTQQSQVLSDIASMVHALTAKKYLVLSVPNADDQTEIKGATNYNTIMALNSALEAAYPNNYLDIRSYMVSQYDPSNPLDVVDHDNDVWPASLRAVDVIGYLAANIGASDATLSMNVQSPTLPGKGYIIEMDYEYMWVTSASRVPNGSYTVNVIRGYAGSTPTSHGVYMPIAGINPLYPSATGYTKVAQQVANWLNSH